MRHVNQRTLNEGLTLPSKFGSVEKKTLHGRQEC